MDESVSTNTIDQLVGHTNGPTEPVVDRDLTRSRSSAYIVHGNFNRLATMCDDITTTGCIVAERDTARTDVENEVYRRVHNYVSSLYSYNEQIRAILDGRLDESIDKGYFFPHATTKGPRSTFDGALSCGACETTFSTATTGVSPSSENSQAVTRATITSTSRNGISRRPRAVI